MRVVQIIDEMRLGGGAEQLQASFAEAVRGSGVEVTVLTLQESEPEPEALLSARGARTVSFPSRVFLSPARAARVVRFLRRGSFDVVHTHLVRSTILGILAARAVGIPSVATLHNSRPNRRLPRGLRVLESWVLRSVADRVVAVGWETARAHRERLGGRPIDVIPNAVPEPARLSAEERSAVRHELEVGPDELLVMAVGRLHPQKAFQDLLRAFVLLDAGPRVQLRIAGRGRQQTALRAEIDRAGLGDRVRLLGLRRDVPRLLAASDLYASSAAWEGLPLATLEAMAAGLPVVATRVGDVPRLVDEASGSLVEPGRPEDLAAALRRVLADPELRRLQGEASRRRVSEHFGAEAWAQRLIALYSDLSRAREQHPTGEEKSCASPW